MANPDADRAEARLRDRQASPQRERGELKASHAPCRRKLIVAESEVLRWIDDDLAYEPVILDPEPPPSVVPSLNGRTRRRRQMPRLDYDPRRGEQQ